MDRLGMNLGSAINSLIAYDKATAVSTVCTSSLLSQSGHQLSEDVSLGPGLGASSSILDREGDGSPPDGGPPGPLSASLFSSLDTPAMIYMFSALTP
jgi:hypothetical protein